jgi:hypothetical protein
VLDLRKLPYSRDTAKPCAQAQHNLLAIIFYGVRRMTDVPLLAMASKLQGDGKFLFTTQNKPVDDSKPDLRVTRQDIGLWPSRHN